MTFFDTLDMIGFLIQDIVLVFIIYFTATKLLRSKTGYLPAFFIFAMLSFLLSGLYWATFTILKPDARMPFAADEIADCAGILLLSTGLVADKKIDRRARAGEVIFTIVFCITNAVLWIIWSGEWLQDIIFGIPYSYFLWLIIRGISDTKVLSVKEVFSLRIVGAVIVSIFFFTAFTENRYIAVTDSICYVLMFGLLIWLLIKSIRCMNLYVSALYFFSTIFVAFGSAAGFYDLALMFNISALIIMYLTLKKEVLK